MNTNKLMYLLFSVILFSIFMNLLWDALGITSPFSYNMIMGTVFTFFALIHGVKYIGMRSTIVLAVVTSLISFIMEYAGVKSGLIYGDYYYGSVLGPKALGTVPWLIPLSWFMFMYASTITVDAAFGGRYSGIAAPFIFAILDSAAMTSLDVLIDPIWVTRGTWIWSGLQKLPANSIFYGIPVQNFFGWLLTSIIIFIPYRIIFFRKRISSAIRDRDFFMPCLIYASIVGVGCIEAWTVLANAGVLFVALMTGGMISIAALLGFLSRRTA